MARSLRRRVATSHPTAALALPEALRYTPQVLACHSLDTGSNAQGGGSNPGSDAQGAGSSCAVRSQGGAFPEPRAPLAARSLSRGCLSGAFALSHALHLQAPGKRRRSVEAAAEAAAALVSLGAAGKDKDEERRQKDVVHLADVSEKIPDESLGQWSVGPIHILEDVSFRGNRADALLLFEAAHGEWVKKLDEGKTGRHYNLAVKGVVDFTANFPAYLERALKLYEDGEHLVHRSPMMQFTLTVATAMAGGVEEARERYYVRSQGS